MERFEIPEDISALSDDELSSAIDSAFSEAGEFGTETELSDEQVERLEALAAFAEAGTAERDGRAQAARDREDRISAARASLTRPEPAEKPEEAEAPAEDAAEDTEQAAVEDTEQAATQEAPAQDAEEATEEVSAQDTADEAPVDESNDKNKEAVVAAGQSAVDRATENADRPNIPGRSPIAITAGAEVPDMALGQKMTNLSELGDAFISKFQSMSPGGMRKGSSVRYNVGRMTLPREDNLVADNADAQEVFTQASNERRLPGGSLVASRQKAGEGRNALVAAGWCAPSETMYDLCSTVTVDGLLSMPEVNVRRGGIRYTQGPDVSGIDISQIGFLQTEAQAEAGEVKECLEIPCADFIEERLDAIGICIKAGLLQVSAYPELVQQYIETYLALYQHRYSMETIDKLKALIGAPQTITGVWENATSILSAIELVAEGYRQDTLIGESETLEAVFPHWVLPALRADLANRNGVQAWNVTDAELLSAFATRNISPQFVRHYQPLDTSSGIAESYPTELEFMLYPAGSYVRGTTDVINLDAVYDSTGLSTNTYTALFAESGLLVAEMCNKGKRVSMSLSVTGRTAANDLTDHFTAIS